MKQHLCLKKYSFSNYEIGSGNTSISCTNLGVYTNTFTGGSAIIATLTATTAGSLVAKDGYDLIFDNVSGLYLGFDAEL